MVYFVRYYNTLGFCSVLLVYKARVVLIKLLHVLEFRIENLYSESKQNNVSLSPYNILRPPKVNESIFCRYFSYLGQK